MTDIAETIVLFDEIDNEISKLEETVQNEPFPPLGGLLRDIKPVLRKLLIAYRSEATVPISDTDDLLEMFRVFVKGEPSLNSIRDNIREFVYYENCLAAQRIEALPKMPERMTVRTLRHIYLYLRSRAEQEGRFD